MTIGRIITRPGSGDIEDFDGPEIVNAVPDLFIGTLFRSGAHLLKSNTIYELVQNDLTGTIELIEVGKSEVNRHWSHRYYDIPDYLGNRMWLTKEELDQVDQTDQTDQTDHIGA